ncbi:uncharacterized protein LOC122665905 [Telopea speciosissima]|uniref:uncharacterized protein LOC122665905 n=1 Tax=Telopea speciosissima TaxID=54955 RepID=UPI001CC33545|nr:uncharacterized protein LOC122665905 [Telopea speciosissima]
MAEGSYSGPSTLSFGAAAPPPNVPSVATAQRNPASLLNFSTCAPVPLSVTEVCAPEVSSARDDLPLLPLTTSLYPLVASSTGPDSVGPSSQGGDHLDLEAMNSFNDCIEDVGADDLRWTSFPLTWSNKRAGSNRIACKLDRFLVNEEWLTAFPSSQASFDNPDISVHSPISLAIQPFTSFGLKPFKFFDIKLKNVKAALKDWNLKVFGNISHQVVDCKERLASLQASLQTDFLNESLALEEKEVSSQLSALLAREESFLKQKSRINWLDLGDSNTAYFHRSVKARLNANSIMQLSRPDGSLVNSVKDIKD